MGRPIKARYFIAEGAKTASDLVKYKGITSPSVGTAGTGYSTGAIATVAAPQDAAGITATISLTITPAGGITGASVSNVGTGYLTAPGVTITPAATQSNTAVATSSSFTLTNVSGVNGIYPGMLVSGWSGLTAFSHVASVGTNTITLDKAITASGGSTGTSITFSYSDTGTSGAVTVSLTSNELIPNKIAATAYLTTGSGQTTSAIIKQEGSRSYLVENTQGRGRVKLATTDSLTAGTMNIIATDGAGSTYWVKKLTARKATLVSRTGTPLITVTNDGTYTVGTAKWTTGASTGTHQVTISTNSI